MFLFGNNQDDLFDDWDDNLEEGDDSFINSDDNLNILQESRAIDSDGDGWSDAVERELGTDPFDPLCHPGVEGELPEDVQISDDLTGIDSDNDGFSDDLERQMGTDPFDASSHPTVVMPHHFGTNMNNTDIADNLEFSFNVKRWRADLQKCGLVLMCTSGDTGSNQYGEDPTLEDDNSPINDLEESYSTMEPTVNKHEYDADNNDEEKRIILIERLAKLRDFGTITEEEFQDRKKMILK